MQYRVTVEILMDADNEQLAEDEVYYRLENGFVSDVCYEITNIAEEDT
jgi:hypothetical protein